MFDAVLLGVAIGVASATKYTGLATFTLLAWAWLARPSIMPAVVTPLAAIVTFVLAAPACVVRPDLMLAALQFHSATMSDPHFPTGVLRPEMGWYGHRYVYQLVVGLPRAMGWPAYAFSLARVLVALRRRSSGDGLIAMWAIPYLLVICGYAVTFERYLFPALPVLSILGARALTAIRRDKIRIATTAAVAILTLGTTLGESRTYDTSQLPQVAQWFRENTAPGVRIRVDDIYPPLDYCGLARTLRRAGFNVVRKGEADYFVTTDFLVRHGHPTCPPIFSTPIERGKMWQGFRVCRSGTVGVSRGGT